MNCPTCQAYQILTRKEKTNLGYQQYQCRQYKKYFNERIGTPFNFIRYSTVIVMLLIFYYTRYKLSLVDVTELMMLWGFSISHETVRHWTQTLETELGLTIREKCWKHAGKKWHMNMTYVYLEIRLYYLYRAIDTSGKLIDVYLSDERDTKAAKRFFKQCQKTKGITPNQFTTNKEPALASAIKTVFELKTKHRTSRYLNNVSEQHHRGIKSRPRARKGSKNTWTTMIYCYVFEELQNYFRTKIKTLAQYRKFISSNFNHYLKLATQMA